MPHDRDEVLARIDLGALADELLGPRRGRGRSATWPCPDPSHSDQTGRTPPVSLFRSPGGQERWHCHACGAGGTAADLVMTTQGVGFAQALTLLAGRAGFNERRDSRPPLRPSAIERRHPDTVVDPGRQIEEHVAACEAYLWSPAGVPMRRWLARRGLGEAVLRANRVSADPGPRSLPRPPGLPRSGPAVILPVLDGDGIAVYLQARYLHPPGGRKYDNPASALAGPSPRLAEVRLARAPAHPGTVLVCEGLPDALIAAQAGHRATALLGAGVPDDRVARILTERFATERLVVALDADDRGRAGSARLIELLEAAGAGRRVAVATIPPAWGDLNGWHLGAGAAFGIELAAAVDQAIPPAAEHRPPLPKGLREQLDAIHNRHVLIDDHVLASRNLARLRKVVAHWERAGMAAEQPGRTGPRSPLERDLETLASQHLLDDDPRKTERSIAAIKDAVDGWSSGLDPHSSRVRRRSALAPMPQLPTDTRAPDRSLGIDL